MTDNEIKQAIMGFAEFFKAITGNHNLEIPSEIAEKYGIQAQADGEYITQSAGDEIRQKNYDLISRQAAIDANCYNCSIKANGGKCSKCDAVKAIEKLPPVKPPMSLRQGERLMDNNKRWNRLMKINKKSCAAINSSKASGNNTIEITLTLEELYEIASLSGNEATILRRKCLS